MKRLLSYTFLTTILALATVNLAVAQTAPDTDLEAKRAEILAQGSGEAGVAINRSIARRLVSSSVTKRTEALHEAVYYATFFSDLIDLAPSTRLLLEVATEDSDEGNRIMAVQALSHIGEVGALGDLARLAQFEASARVQRIILLAVAEISRRYA